MMKKIFKYLLYAGLLIILIIAGLLLYVSNFLPKIDAPNIKVELTPERIERGKYLANHVAVCMDCHSTRDWSKFSGPPIPGTEGKGGELFDQGLGLPGKYTSKNITPFHLGDWSDGEIYRAICNGVNKQGKALFPIMPYPGYGKLDDEDIKSIIAYIRSLKPLESKPEESKSDFPMNFIINTIPSNQAKLGKPDKSDIINYGKYVTTAAGCIDCHTQMEKGEFVKNMEFAGGREFPMPFGTLRSKNITFDKETGIGTWSKEVFINKFKSYDPSSYQPASVSQKQFNTIMPWTMYAGMTTEDIGAIYEYLRSLKTVNNRVQQVSFK